MRLDYQATTGETMGWWSLLNCVLSVKCTTAMRADRGEGKTEMT